MAQSKDTSAEIDVCSVSTASSIQHSTTSTQSVTKIPEMSKSLEITHSNEKLSHLADTTTGTQSSSTERNFKGRLWCLHICHNFITIFKHIHP